MNPPLARWSAQDLFKIYGVLGKQLQEYEAIRGRIDIPRAMNIDFTDDDNIFINRFWRDVLRIEGQLGLLDKEIKRRNNLIGVI